MSETNGINGNGNLVMAIAPITRENGSKALVYGERMESLPISDTESVEIDAALFSGKTQMRLLNIKLALKVAGKGNDKETRKWFNDEVRDPFHKALRYMNKRVQNEWTPKSVGFTRRHDKKGNATITGKFGYEHSVKVATPESLGKEIANGEVKAGKQSVGKAKRQANKKAKALKNPETATAPETAPVETKNEETKS